MMLNRLAIGFLIGLASFATAALAQRSTPLQVLHPAGAANDRFGQSVAVDGDTMVVGAPSDNVGSNLAQGSVHVYRWTGSGWTFEATLTAADGALNDQFGSAVAINGDTVIVGAPFDGIGANTAQGSAYVFTRSGATWTQQARLIAAGGAALDNFGWSVALSGDTAVVGAFYDDVGANANQGSAYVFVRSPGSTTWTQQAQLTATGGAADDSFGVAVAVSGDAAIIGAYTDDVGPNQDQGSAYVFTRSGTTWTQQAQLTASDGAMSDTFGTSVGLGRAGDTAIVGASLGDVGPNQDQGSAYVFTRSGATWSQQAKLTASGGTAEAWFGSSVALDGDSAIVGAQLTSFDAAGQQGAAYVFVRSGTTWTQQSQLTAPDRATSDFFGVSVAMSGDNAVVGAYNDAVGANTFQGSAWVFSRVGSTWIGPDMKLLAADGAGNDNFGFSVAVTGDTAVVGAYLDNVGTNSQQGSAYVFVRSGTAWTQQAKLTASDGAANDHFGTSVALSGDTAIVGAEVDDVGTNTDQGSAYVFVRSGTTWTQQRKLTASDGAVDDKFGTSVALGGAGDTALIGANFDDVVAPDQGSAYVFTRSGTTWTQQVKLFAADGAAYDSFGSSVALGEAGDTALIGSYLDDVGANTDQGSAYVFTRFVTAWTQQGKLTASDGAANDYFGLSVALSGDTAIVGAEGDDVGTNTNQGSAYVFTRSGTSWTQEAKLVAADGTADDGFGASVALSGDTGIVGAPFYDVGAYTNQGAACVFTRAGTTWTQRAKLVASDGEAFDNFAVSVAISGDTGVVGAVADNVGTNGNQGSAWTFGVSAADFILARNDSTATTYSTLAAALLPAQSGHQITATDAAWRNIGILDTTGRSLSLRSSGDLRTPSTSTITLWNGSALIAPPGSTLEIFGQLRAAGASYPDVYADSFLLGSRGTLTVRTGASLNFNVPEATLCGLTRTEANTYLTFNGNLHTSGLFVLSDASTWTTWGSVTNTGSVSVPANCSVVAGGSITNRDTFTATTGMINTPLFDNRGAANFFGTSALFGSYFNQAGAVTTIRSGTLYVFGSLTNNGTILGTICSNCLGTPPNLDVGGDLVLGPAANLLMPFNGSIVHVGGDFDCAIDSNTRYDMSLATLQMEGAATEQTLEAMSVDRGRCASGNDRATAGNYPVGVLHIGGSAPSVVRIVDARDNDGAGQTRAEAIYVGTLRIDAGSRLANAGFRVYYTTLINNGTVDVPGNLFAAGTSACRADFNNSGTVSVQDIFDFLAGWFSSDAQADVNCSGAISVQDIFDFLAGWFTGCA